MTTTETKDGPKIELTDAGPIEGSFKIDLSKGPGVREIRGRRGCGKTTIISSIDWLAGHKVDVTLHDGAVSGKVEGLGVVAPIGGRKRRKGDFELDTIDAEKFSISDIVDPPGKTAEVRDAHVIKALASLSEMEADPKLYYELAGGQEAFDQMGISPTDDPVLLATRVKKAYDQLASARKKTAEAEAGHAIPLEHVPDGLDMNESSDMEMLGAARDEFRDTLQKLKTQREQGLSNEKDIADAKTRLEKIRSEYSGPTVEDAEKYRQEAIAKGAAAQAKVERLERELEHARSNRESCKTVYEAANQTMEAARSHTTAVVELEAISDTRVTYPEQGAIEESTEDVNDATLAYDRGVRIRDVLQNQAKAKKHREAETAAEKESAAAKARAGEVFDLLAQAMHTEHLLIESVDGDPRLFVQHPIRKKTLFDRVNGLSDGERVDFTLRELLPHIEPPGMLPIPQRVWQDLQPTDRQNLHKLAVDKKLYLFGAQVDDGELRVVWLGEE